MKIFKIRYLMNSLTLAFIAMLETLKTMVTANLAKFTVIPAFAPAYAEITTRLTAMQALKPTAVKKTKPTVDANTALKIELCDKTEAVADTILALAGKLGDVALKEQMKVKAYKLKKKGQGVLVPLCRNIHTLATTHKVAAADYNLTQAMLDELDDLINDYAAEVPEVSTETGVINAAKADIERYKLECKEILEGQLDPMVKILRKTDITAVELWESARVVKDPPSTTTQIKFKVFTIDNGDETPIPDVPITATGLLSYTAISDELGNAIIKPIPHGLYNITATMPGFQPFLLKDFKVVRGRINKVNIVLVRIP